MSIGRLQKSNIKIYLLIIELPSIKNRLKSFLMTITMILIKYQENKSEPFYPRSLIKNFQTEQLQEDLLL